MIKLTWKVDPKPTGRYASFQNRSWPMAEVRGHAVIQISCADQYEPWRVRTGEHAELTVMLAQWRDRPGDSKTFDWRRLKRRARTLDEAKELARQFLEANPSWIEALPE